MNQAEIIAMATEAGFGMQMALLDLPYCQADAQRLYQQLERFAALVAAKEREACAKVAESMAPEFGEKGWAARDRGDFTLSLGMLGVEFQLKECASAIRARGTKEGA